MSVLEMRLLPDPIIRQKAKPVAVVDQAIEALISNMTDTMRAAGGVGLAGNQVGFLKRLVVIELPDEDVRVLVNPEIIEREGEREVDEGCLSIPGYRGKVNRSERVKARWSDLEGNLTEIDAEGLLAQALEHETDHINGILYVDHLISKDSFWKITDTESSGDNESQEESAGSK